MIEPTDQLHHRALAGDLRAASEFIGHFYERICAYFRRLCGNHEDARDLTQETLCKAWTSFKSVRNHASFSGWLHRIAYHLYVDWLRNAGRVVDRSDAWWQTCVPEANTPFDSAVESELASQLHALVRSLGSELAN